MNQQLYSNLLIAARRLVRVAYEPADELLNEDDNWDQVAYAMALLRCQVQALDIEQLNDELELQRTRAERAERALERRQADYEQIQSLYAQAREELKLARKAQHDAQSNYANERHAATNGVRVVNAWQCLRCGEYTRPSETNVELCESCEILRQQIVIEQLTAHQGGNL